MKRKPIILTTPEGRRKFYASPEWQALRRIKLVHNPFCEKCLIEDNFTTMAEDVHHRTEIKDDPSKALKYNNLQSLCHSCHSTITYNSNSESIRKSRLFEVVNLKWDIEKMAENSKNVNFSVDI